MRKVLDTIEIKKKIVKVLIAALKELERLQYSLYEVQMETIKPISDISHRFLID